MLGSNPSADSVASTDVGGGCGIPFSSVAREKPTIGRGTQTLNPGGAGAKPPQAALAAYFLLKHGPSHNAYVWRGQGQSASQRSQKPKTPPDDDYSGSRLSGKSYALISQPT